MTSKKRLAPNQSNLRGLDATSEREAMGELYLTGRVSEVPGFPRPPSIASILAYEAVDCPGCPVRGNVMRRVSRPMGGLPRSTWHLF